MSRLQSLKLFMNQRISAAVEEIFGHVERTMVEYEEEMNRRHFELIDVVSTPEAKLRTEADVQQLLVVKEEQKEWSSSLDQEDPEPPHIKEEQEELWTSQEGEQLQGLEEADIKFSFTPVKSEDDEEEAQSSQLHQRQTEQMETEADGEDCGGPEPGRNSDPDKHPEPDTGDSSEPETEDSADNDFWEESCGRLSGLNSLKHVDVSQSNETFTNHHRRRSPRGGEQSTEGGSLSRRMDPEPPHIKEEQEELWTSQEGEQLQGLEEADVKFSFTPVKSEDDDEEEAQSSQLHQRQTEQTETEADGEDCGGPEPDRNLDPDTDDETEDSSETSSDDSDDWKQNRDQHSGSNSLIKVLDKRCYADKNLCICTDCGKRFGNSTNLKVHKLIHTGLKPFCCTLCSRRYPQQRKLMRHMKRHVPEKTFSCSVCDKRFRCSGDVKRHMRSHIGESLTTS